MSTPTNAELAEAVLTLAASLENDLSICPYFSQRGVEGSHGPNTCVFGCSEEPACHTEQPEEGWPRQRLPQSVQEMIAEADDRFCRALIDWRDAEVSKILDGAS